MSDFGNYFFVLGAALFLVMTAIASLSKFWRFIFNEMDPVTKRKIRLFPRQVESLAFVAVFLCIASSILAWPSSPLINQLTGIGSDSSIMSVLLKTSAALLALLIFAATQMRNMEKDTGASEKYLGFNKTEFSIQNSPAFRILNLPMFRFAILALFVAPMLISMVGSTTSLDLPFFFEQDTLKLLLIILAIWGASFVLVAAALIFNVLSILKTAATGVFYPSRIDQKIETQLEESSQASFTRLLNSSNRNQRLTDVSTFASGLLDQAEKLPARERSKYLRLIFPADLSSKLASKLHRQFRRTAKLAAKTSASDTRKNSLKLPDQVREWLLLANSSIIFKSLNRFSNFEVGCAQAMLNWLASPSRDEYSQMRSALIRSVLSTANYLSDTYQRLDRFVRFFDESTSATSTHDLSQKLKNQVFCSAQEVDDLTQPRKLQLRRTADVQAKKNLQKQPAEIYQGLCNAVLSTRKRELPSTVNSDDLDVVFQSATRIKHDPTRSFIQGLLIETVLEKTVIARSDSESLGMDTLATLLPDRQIFDSQYRKLDDRHRPTAVPPTPNQIAEQVAFRALLGHQKITPDEMETTLQFIQGWRIPAVLLHSLFYGVRSGHPAANEVLAVFSRPLDGFGDDTDTVHSAAQECRRFIASSGISYFAFDSAVAWLFEALERPLTFGLCVEFLEAVNTESISDFRLLQFVQWHLLAGAQYSFAPSKSPITPTPEQLSRISASKNDLKVLAEQWKQKNTLASDRLYRLIYEISCEVPDQPEH